MALDDPVSRLIAVTPSDTLAFAFGPATCIYVGVAGDLAVHTGGGDTITVKNAPVGWHPIRCDKVLVTGTTAQEILAGR